MAHARDELARATETNMPEPNRSATAMAEDTMRRASEETAKATERQQQAMEQMSAGMRGGNGRASEQGEQRPH